MIGPDPGELRQICLGQSEIRLVEGAIRQIRVAVGDLLQPGARLAVIGRQRQYLIVARCHLAALLVGQTV